MRSRVIVFKNRIIFFGALLRGTITEVTFSLKGLMGATWQTHSRSASKTRSEEENLPKEIVTSTIVTGTCTFGNVVLVNVEHDQKIGTVIFLFPSPPPNKKSR